LIYLVVNWASIFINALLQVSRDRQHHILLPID